MQLRADYPTPQHAAAARVITGFFSTRYDVQAVMLLNSCARGKATRDSCLDLAVLAEPDWLSSNLGALESDWSAFEARETAIQDLKQVGTFSDVHPAFIDGVFEPQERDEAAGPDDFELQIGNFLAYSVPLWQRGDYLARLKSRWLPYYPDNLRRQRLQAVRWFCLNNLHHIPLYVERGLYFQSLDRLYNAHQEFLQALFITRRVYPIAYNKWVREQVVDILGLPDLYPRLTSLFEIGRLESDELAARAEEVERLLNEYAPAPDAE
jgi:predicted nucleotidyltransferase